MVGPLIFPQTGEPQIMILDGLVLTEIVPLTRPNEALARNIGLH